MTFIAAVTATWNNAGTTFEGIWLDVTDTASQALSRLFRVSIGGTTRAQINKDGRFTVFPASGTGPGLAIDSPNTGVPGLFGGFLAGVVHWTYGPGGGAADDFAFNRFNDAGTFQGQPVAILRATGEVQFNNAPFGYGPGAGAAVTQTTNKSTAVTTNTPNGHITMNNAALAANTTVKFTVNCTAVKANDQVKVTILSGAADFGAYNVWGGNVVANTSFQIALRNISAGSLSEALVLQVGLERGNVA